MIDKLVLKNFQSHKNSTLELCNGVNVIVGESDVGKSAIVRALYWLAFGKPTGASILRHDVINPAVVEAHTADGVLKKIRWENRGQYELNGEIYKGFGGAIPKPVSDFLNLGDINFMRQLDPPFMFSKNGAELAQYLNKLISLEVIDSSLTNIKKAVNQSKAAIESTRDIIDRIQMQIEDLPDIDALEPHIAKLEKQERKIDKLKATSSELLSLLQTHRQHSQTMKSLNWVSKAKKRIRDISEAQNELEQKTEKYNALELAFSRLQKANMTIDKQTDPTRLRRAFSRLETANEQLRRTTDVYNGLKYSIGVYQTACNDLARAENELAQANKEWKANKPKTCPTCGQKWE